MNNINDIYKMLNWKTPPETQLKGIGLAKEINDLSLLIQPPAEPSVWENCARVLSKKTDDELSHYLVKLLEWLQDLNWPGALIILDRLKNFSGEELKEPFIDCVIYASSLNNVEGLIRLDYLSELLDNKALKIKLPKEILDKLQTHYHNWGAWDSD